jgi:uncharacterized protein
MKPCLVDVNVVVALLVADHVHNSLARKWFDMLAAEEAGICRFVELAVVRLLGNRHVMGSLALTAAEGWRVVRELSEDERILYLDEPAGIEPLLTDLLEYSVAAGKLVSDAYLAAFAIASSRTLLTFDADFRRFRGLRLKLLDR